VNRGAGILLVVLLVLAGCLATACAGRGVGQGRERVDREAFERGMMERERITAEQAHCFSQGIFEFYRPDEIRQIDDDGFTALPVPRWSGYQRLMGRCLFSGQLAGLPPPTRPELPSAQAGR
jgi:hypothetical protein